MGTVAKRVLAAVGGFLFVFLLLLLLPEQAFGQAQGVVRPIAPNSAITSPLIEGFVGAAQQIARGFATRVASEILILLNYAFLIWLLLQVAQMMLGMTGGASTLWSIVRRSALYMIVAFMLASISTGTYWQWFVEEPIRIAAALSAEAMGRPGCGSSSAAEAASCLARGMEEVFTNPLYASWRSISATQFSLEALISGAAISQYSAGALLALISFIGLVFFAFFILDVVLRILVLAMFSAVFVAAFLFNPTRGWATGAAWNLVSSIATLVGGSSVLAMLDAAIRSSLGGGGWPAIISEIAASGSRYDSPINLDRVVFWQALFLCLVSVGVAKAISQMMTSIFNSAPAGSPMADKAAGIAAIPAKAAVATAAIGAGFMSYIGLKGASAAAEYGLQQTKQIGGSIAGGVGQSVQNLKSRISFGGGNPLGGGTDGGSPGGGGGRPPGGGTGGGGGMGSGTGGTGTGAFGPGFSSSATSGGPTAQTNRGATATFAGLGSGNPESTQAQTIRGAIATSAAQAAATPGAQTGSQTATGVAQDKKAKKGKSAYKAAFIYETAVRIGGEAADATNPMSRTGT